ncbi:MAG: hypothetical protein HY096_12520 [Nitrospinae bacterium]|nr:hypothetical protein [Nitrospinota bacterium]
MHALGMIWHFDGFFNGNDGGIKDVINQSDTNQYGKKDSFARAVLMNMYQNPSGTTKENLKISSY